MNYTPPKIIVPKILIDEQFRKEFFWNNRPIINDYRQILPWHPTRRWDNRQLSSIQRVILHQSATPATYEQINKAHITPGQNNHLSTAGCPHVAYHIGIRKNGDVLLMNDFIDITWHCKGANSLSIGVNIQGDFPGNGWKGSEQPTDEQMKSLNLLLYRLYNKELSFLNPISSLFGHCDIDPTNRPADPGFVIYDFMKEWKIEFKK